MNTSPSLRERVEAAQAHQRATMARAHAGGGVSTERALWRSTVNVWREGVVDVPQGSNNRTARTLDELDFNPQDWLRGPYFARPHARRVAKVRRVAAFVAVVAILVGAAFLSGCSAETLASSPEQVLAREARFAADCRAAGGAAYSGVCQYPPAPCGAASGVGAGS